MKSHVHGIILALLAWLGGLIEWVLQHLQAIDLVMQFLLLLISLVTAIIGARKVFARGKP